MLVLSRKVGEKIWIAPGIFVTLLEVNGHSARLGIEAPPDIKIFRTELFPDGKPPSEPVAA